MQYAYNMHVYIERGGRNGHLVFLRFVCLLKEVFGSSLYDACSSPFQSNVSLVNSSAY